jgi:hypothetical protein
MRCLYEEAFSQGKPKVIDKVLDPNYVCYDSLTPRQER